MSIMSDLAKGMDPERVANREVLLAAVQRQITCQLTGKVLDVSNAVLLTRITVDGKRAAIVFQESEWEKIRPVIVAQCAETGDSWEALVSSELGF